MVGELYHQPGLHGAGLIGERGSHDVRGEGDGDDDAAAGGAGRDGCRCGAAAGGVAGDGDARVCGRRAEVQAGSTPVAQRADVLSEIGAEMRCGRSDRRGQKHPHGRSLSSSGDRIRLYQPGRGGPLLAGARRRSRTKERHVHHTPGSRPVLRNPAGVPRSVRRSVRRRRIGRPPGRACGQRRFPRIGRARGPRGGGRAELQRGGETAAVPGPGGVGPSEGTGIGRGHGVRRRRDRRLHPADAPQPLRGDDAPDDSAPSSHRDGLRRHTEHGRRRGGRVRQPEGTPLGEERTVQ
mmetsp:Transcript_23164/g.68382  ORF Transcript_23164/g.68382 Transcript_23164/m.68382 type:complete len:294 (-) Transcript_23164:90-971(-)